MPRKVSVAYASMHGTSADLRRISPLCGTPGPLIATAASRAGGAIARTQSEGAAARYLWSPCYLDRPVSKGRLRWTDGLPPRRST